MRPAITLVPRLPFEPHTQIWEAALPGPASYASSTHPHPPPKLLHSRPRALTIPVSLSHLQVCSESRCVMQNNGYELPFGTDSHRDYGPESRSVVAQFKADKLLFRRWA
ncbi:hypothetical protein VE02_04301 [Pseudogymnoascus sp. 03VT05]|nr:hypothetical protein VE02_04301 [Pseudogymnoascus sp. 03VT05]